VRENCLAAMEARWLVSVLLTAACVAAVGQYAFAGDTPALPELLWQWAAGTGSSRRRRRRAGRAEGVKQGVLGCIGGTPLVRLNSLSDATGCEVRVCVCVCVCVCVWRMRVSAASQRPQRLGAGRSEWELDGSVGRGGARRFSASASS
jgi:hypothetical protein